MNVHSKLGSWRACELQTGKSVQAKETECICRKLSLRVGLPPGVLFTQLGSRHGRNEVRRVTVSQLRKHQVARETGEFLSLG